MAAKTKAPVTGEIHVDPDVLKAAIARLKLKDAGAGEVSFATRNRQVLLTGGNGEALLELTLECAFKGRFACRVDYRALRDAAAAQAKGTDVIVLEQDRAHLRLTGSAITAIDLLYDRPPERGKPAPLGEPQIVPALADGRELVIAWGAQLAEAVASVAFAASRDDTRPLLMAVLLESDGRQTGPFQGPHVAATDSYRLFAHPLPGAQGEFRVAADARGMLDATKGLTGEEGVVVSTGTATGRPVVQVERDGERWLIHSPSGEWPQWRQLYPDTRPIHFTVDRAELAVATALAAKHQGDDFSLTYRIPATVKTLKAGEKLDREFGIDPVYINSAVKHLTGDTVRFEYNGPTKPVRVAAGDVAGLIMPVRIGENRTTPVTAKKDVPLRIEIGDAEVVLRMDPFVKPEPPSSEPEPAAVAKDLADVPGVVKRGNA